VLEEDRQRQGALNVKKCDLLDRPPYTAFNNDPSAWDVSEMTVAGRIAH